MKTWSGEEYRDCLLKLLSTYYLVFKYTQKLPSFIWLPISFVFLGKDKKLPVIKLPILRSIILIFISNHLKCTLDLIQREFLLRMAVAADESEREEVNELVKQVKSMQESLPRNKKPSWLIAVSVFMLILLGRSILPQEYSNYIPRIIVAFVTSDLEQISKLATDPKILEVLTRLGLLVLMILIGFCPVAISHFRFKRMLFNDAQQLNNTNLRLVSLKYIWEQNSSYADSLYNIEDRMFRSLESSIVTEYPLDLALIICAYIYCGLGAGLFLCIISLLAKSQILFLVGLFNIIIGFSSVATAIYSINQRSKFKDRNQPSRFSA